MYKTLPLSKTGATWQPSCTTKTPEISRKRLPIYYWKVFLVQNSSLQLTAFENVTAPKLWFLIVSTFHDIFKPDSRNYSIKGLHILKWNQALESWLMTDHSSSYHCNLDYRILTALLEVAGMIATWLVFICPVMVVDDPDYQWSLPEG